MWGHNKFWNININKALWESNWINSGTSRKHVKIRGQAGSQQNYNVPNQVEPNATCMEQWGIGGRSVSEVTGPLRCTNLSEKEGILGDRTRRQARGVGRVLIHKWTEPSSALRESLAFLI